MLDTNCANYRQLNSRQFASPPYPGPSVVKEKALRPSASSASPFRLRLRRAATMRPNCAGVDTVLFPFLGVPASRRRGALEPRSPATRDKQFHKPLKARKNVKSVFLIH